MAPASLEEPIEPPTLSKSGQAAAELKVNGVSHLNGVEPNAWSPASWTTKPIKQEVIYDDRAAVSKALAKLERSPPIVTPYEIMKLRKNLRDVALGKAFLLHGGDCAELFDYCEQSAIESKIKLLLQMSLVLIWGLHKPVVRIGRMAGQYAKPRSKPTEMYQGREIPSFRGDILNGYAVEDRKPDPERLVQAYHHSANTLNFIRASLASGLADLHSPMDWELGHVKDEAIHAQYTRIVESITGSLRFMQTIGADGAASSLETVDLYTSHEGLLLEYEQSLTRKLPNPPSHAAITAYTASRPTTPSTTPATNPPSYHPDHHHPNRFPSAPTSSWYNTSAHFLWIGDRTRQLGGAHVEFFRGIENPIGIKVGPSMEATELVSLLDIVNPLRQIGKVTLITRYGESQISAKLPSHIRAVRASGHVVIWQCDPMHGNTLSTPSGIKTRQFASILSEVSSCLAIHAAEGSYLGGVHLELTGEAVTECVGGSEGLTEGDLGVNYTTYCDPRLNEKQALELAFLVAGFFREREVEEGNKAI